MAETCRLERESTYGYAQLQEMGNVIGGNIKRLRMAAGHRHQGHFAKLIQVSQQWLSDVERGRNPLPDTDNLIKIAAAIPCSLDALVSGFNQRFDSSRTSPVTPPDQRSAPHQEVPDATASYTRLLG